MNLITVQVRVEADELPRTANELCVYDLLILTADGLAQASEKSLAAVSQWVLAGGSLLIEADGQLERQHLEFLQRVAPLGDGNAPLFLLDPSQHDVGSCPPVPSSLVNDLLERGVIQDHGGSGLRTLFLRSS